MAIADPLSESVDNVRKPELPGELGNAFFEIENQVIALHAEFGVHQQLFATEEDWALLVNSSPYGWSVLQDALVERCILRINRLIDRNERTVSLPNLVNLLKKDLVGKSYKGMKCELDALKTPATPLKELRDKVLAHTDWDVVVTSRMTWLWVHGQLGPSIVSVSSIGSRNCAIASGLGNLSTSIN